MQKFNNVAELQSWLEGEGIDTLSWGRGEAKHVDDLWQEVVNGEITIQGNPVQRTVNVVQVIIRKENCILMEIEQEFGNGARRSRNRPPSEKMKPGENYAGAALRCLQEELGAGSQDVVLIPSTYRKMQQEDISYSYPGLPTKYIFHIIEARVKGLPDVEFWQENASFAEEGDPVKRHLWSWRPGDYLW